MSVGCSHLYTSVMLTLKHYCFSNLRNLAVNIQIGEDDDEAYDDKYKIFTLPLLIAND